MHQRQEMLSTKETVRNQLWVIMTHVQLQADTVHHCLSRMWLVLITKYPHNVEYCMYFTLFTIYEFFFKPCCCHWVCLDCRCSPRWSELILIVIGNKIRISDSDQTRVNCHRLHDSTYSRPTLHSLQAVALLNFKY